MDRSPFSLALVAAAALAACAPAAKTAPRAGTSTATSAPKSREALAALLSEHWEYFLTRRPEWATLLGDHRHDDRSSDFSAAAEAADVARTKDFLARFEAIDPAGLDEQEALTRTLMIRAFREELAGARFEWWKTPVSQMHGIHLMAARFPSLLGFRDARDLENYAARLRNLPKQLEDTTANIRLGMEAGLVPPRFLLEKVAKQAAGIAAMEPEASPFAQVLEKLPAGLPEAERARLRAVILSAVKDHVLPAYARFARFVAEEYAPRGRTEVGIWSLPDGAARYAHLVEESTTTRLSPGEIHELGLREVARIEEEMRAAARAAGFEDLAAFRKALATDPRYRPTSREQILEIYRGHIEAMKEELPRLFGRLPRAGFEVEAVEAFREKEAAAAQYQMPAPDGSRPGRIVVNTGDFAGRKTISMESTAYHEGLPGHHMQIAIQQELEGLPAQRRFWLHYNAFAEGWALYSERLGREVGLFRDPASYYGHLEDEMLRAIRLVVDTGLHEKRWTREQVVKFFHDHSALDEVDVQAETDRYIVWPGQALAYKVGQLEILSLRDRAERRLGKAFDLRAFHDLLLGGGSLPLDVLAGRVGAWIAAGGVAP